MADVQTIIDEQPGPLPIEVYAEVHSGAPAMVMISGSVFSSSPSSLVGIQLSIDGNMMKKARIFANESSTHLAVVPDQFSYKFTGEGKHIFRLDPLTSETMADENDNFNVSLLL